MSKSSWSNTLWLEQPSYPWGNSDQLGTSACSIAWLNHGIADPCALFGNDTNRVLTSVYLPAHLLYSSRSQSAFLSPLHSLLHPGSKSPQTFSRTTHTKSSRYKWTPTPMPNMLTLSVHVSAVAWLINGQWATYHVYCPPAVGYCDRPSVKKTSPPDDRQANSR